MAAAWSGLATIFGGVKMECSTPSSSIPHSPASARTLRFPIARRAPRSLSLQTRREPLVITRCDGADAEVEEAPLPASARDASLSALEQFKFSAGDRYMKEKSSIAVIGVSFHTAPIELREKVAVPEAQCPHAIKELCDLNHIEEAAVLSTCNRMEIYVVALSWHRGIREVTEWMSKTSGIPVSEFRQYLFMLRDSDAVRHLFEVSAGLDSLVLGEGQIAAQVRQVLNIGAIGGLGKNVDRLFKDAISAGALVRRETNISSGAVSASSAAVELALKKLPFPHSQSVRMLVIGAGKIGKLLIKHLAAKGCKKVVVVSSSEEKVAAIGKELKDADIIYKPHAEMFSAAAEADVVFTSTSSEVPLFLKEHAQALPPVSDSVGGLRLFIDISVPRNVGSCVSDLKSVRVYNVDDLNEVMDANNNDRLRKAMEAHALITQRVKKFEAWRDSLDAVPTITRLHAFAKEIAASELEKCFEKIGDNALTKKIKRAIYELARGIVNKLLDGPFQHLKCTGSDDRTQDEILENIHALNRMFNLNTDKGILEQKIKAKIEKAQNQDG